jgi:hypothetical protein
MKKLKIKRRRPGTVRQANKSDYALHANVRETAKEQSRKTYRHNRGKDFELGGATVLRSLEFVDAEAQTLPVANTITAQVERLPVLRLTNVAALLNVSYQTLWRWTTETEQLPMPVLVDQSTERGYDVYHLEEVRIMIGVIGEHLNDFKYYRKDHDIPRNKLVAQIDALRANNFNEKGSTTHGNKITRKKTRRRSKSKSN